jgi:hypothetical protein
VELPAAEKSSGVFRGQKPVAAQRVGAFWILAEPVTGQVALEVR